MRGIKFIKFLLGFFLITGLLVGVVLVRKRQETRRGAALTPLVVFTPNKVQDPEKDQIVDVLMSLSFDKKVSAIDLTIPYKCEYLELRKITENLAGAFDTLIYKNRGECGEGDEFGRARIVMVQSDLSAPKKAGPIATLRFRIKKAPASREEVVIQRSNWAIQATGPGAGSNYFYTGVGGARLRLLSSTAPEPTPTLTPAQPSPTVTPTVTGVPTVTTTPTVTPVPGTPQPPVNLQAYNNENQARRLTTGTLCTNDLTPIWRWQKSSSDTSAVTKTKIKRSWLETGAIKTFDGLVRRWVAEEPLPTNDPNKKYCLQVAFGNDKGWSNWSEPACVRVDTQSSPPSNLSFTVVTKEEIRAEWERVSDIGCAGVATESAYRYQLARGGGFGDIISQGWRKITQPWIRVTENLGINNGDMVYLRVRVKDKLGNLSDWSETISQRVGVCLEPQGGCYSSKTNCETNCDADGDGQTGDACILDPVDAQGNRICSWSPAYHCCGGVSGPRPSVSPGPTLPPPPEEPRLSPPPTVPPLSCDCQQAREYKARGDANCDGSTNTLDFEIWFDTFIRGNQENGLAADFDCNGQVTIDDYQRWLDGNPLYQ